MGSEPWRLEGYIDISEEDGSSPIDYDQLKQRPKIDEVVRDLEASWGKSIVPIQKVSCVEKGGILEKVESDEKPEEPEESDVTMDNTEAFFEFAANIDSPAARDIAAIDRPPISQAESTAATGSPEVSNTDALIQQPVTANLSESNVQQTIVPSVQDMDIDVEMAGVPRDHAPTSAEGETGDWIMINKDEKPSKDEPYSGNDKQEGDSSGTASTAPPASTPGLQGLTPGGPTEPAGESEALETSNFDDAAEFTNIDSAGDAFAAYGEQNDELDMGDSAFGDAFHALDGEHNHHDTEDIA
jgi:hypothetical protein